MMHFIVLNNRLQILIKTLRAVFKKKPVIFDTGLKNIFQKSGSSHSSTFMVSYIHVKFEKNP